MLLLALTPALGCKPEGATAPPPSTAPSSTGSGPESSTGGSAEEPGAPNVPWAAKDRKQRTEFMGLYVFPRMKDAFQGHDAKAFAEFRCQTCHGDDFERSEVDFKMPNDLYPLPAADPVTAAKEYDAEVTAFMVEQVVPQMAELLGKEPGKEFGCLNCHPSE